MHTQQYAVHRRQPLLNAHIVEQRTTSICPKSQRSSVILSNQWPRRSLKINYTVH